MKLPFEIWILTICLLSIIIGTITSKSFWQLIKKKCKHCDGERYIEIVGEGFWEKCEHCN